MGAPAHPYAARTLFPGPPHSPRFIESRRRGDQNFRIPAVGCRALLGDDAHIAQAHSVKLVNYRDAGRMTGPAHFHIWRQHCDGAAAAQLQLCAAVALFPLVGQVANIAQGLERRPHPISHHLLPERQFRLPQQAIVAIINRVKGRVDHKFGFHQLRWRHQNDYAHPVIRKSAHWLNGHYRIARVPWTGPSAAAGHYPLFFRPFVKGKARRRHLHEACNPVIGPSSVFSVWFWVYHPSPSALPRCVPEGDPAHCPARRAPHHGNPAGTRG